jgi:hypothetical protein
LSSARRHRRDALHERTADGRKLHLIEGLAVLLSQLPPAARHSAGAAIEDALLAQLQSSSFYPSVLVRCNRGGRSLYSGALVSSTMAEMNHRP